MLPNWKASAVDKSQEKRGEVAHTYTHSIWISLQLSLHITPALQMSPATVRFCPVLICWGVRPWGCCGSCAATAQVSNLTVPPATAAAQRRGSAIIPANNGSQVFLNYLSLCVLGLHKFPLQKSLPLQPNSPQSLSAPQTTVVKLYFMIFIISA